MANVGAIPNGIGVRIDTAITAPAAGNTFTFPLDPGGNDFSVTFEASGTVTTLSGDLQISINGAPFVNLAVAFLTAAAPAKTVTPIVAGASYRINYTTASGSINVDAIAN